MTYQSNFNAYTAFKAQSGLGSAASGSGGTILRGTGGTPAKLTKAPIESKEVRRDAQRTRGRHGMQQSAGGPYGCEVSVGSFDAIYAALFRGSWSSAIDATASDFTSVTISGGNTITWLGGNPITKGFRVNDVIRLADALDAGNNDRNIRIAGLSSTAITTVESLTNNASADTGLTISRVGRKVIMPAAGSLTSTYFTVEEVDSDIDSSRVFQDAVFKSGKWTMQPNGLLTFEPMWMGTGQMAIEESGSSPVLTSPTLPTGEPLAVLDATLRVNGADVADLTAFDLTLDNGAVAPAVAASKYSPTVSPGLNSCSMNLKFLKRDMSWDDAYLNETSMSLSILAVANESELKDFIAINVPFFTLGSADPSPISQQGGVREMSISVPAALIGHDTTGTGYDDTMMSIQISNAS